MAWLLRGAYSGLLAWQIVWHALLPPPAGAALPWLALVAAAPLLPLLRGVWNRRPRALTWATYVLIPYFLVGVTEAWSNPPQRAAAWVHLLLVCVCLGSIGALSRRRAPVEPG